MARGIFVTGTDTGVGKSWVSVGLMATLQRQGLRVLGMKPVASGCVSTPDGLRNEDALLLQQQGSCATDYNLINPYAFAPAIAPHLAAAQTGTAIELEVIAHHYRQLSTMADVVVVEGAGGWLVPLNDRETMADLAKQLDLEVILVVGLRLGCINHALLSAAAIQARGCTLLGWVANTIDASMPELQPNIESIRSRLGCPLLGTVPFLPRLSSDAIADRITLA